MKPNPMIQRVGMVVGIAAVYFAAAKLGLSLAFVNASATAVWPPTGIALAAVLVLGDRALPGVLLGAFLANATITGLTLTTAGIALGNTLEAAAGAWLLNRFANGIHVFDRVRDIFKFTVLAGFISTSISATIGVSSLVLGKFAAPAEAQTIWFTWWLGDVVGALLVTPVLVLWAMRPRFAKSPRRVAEAALVLALTIFIAVAVFGGLTLVGANNDPWEYAILPILVWSAFRFGQREAATLSLVFAGLATWGTVNGFGPFVTPSQNLSLVLLQSFMAVIAVTTIALAAEVSNRKRIEIALQTAHDALQQRVEEQAISLSGAQKDLRLYADIIQHIPLGVAVIRLEKLDDLTSLKIIAMNPNTAIITGINPEDYVGKYLIDVRPQVFETDSPKMYAEVIRTGESKDFGDVRNTDSRIRGEYFAAKLFPLPNQCVAVILEDITERKRTEEALRQQKELYDSMLKAQSDLGEGVALTEGTRFSYVNQALARMYGYSVDELMAMTSTFDLVVPEDRQRLAERFRQRVSGEDIPLTGDTVVLHKDGHRINIEYAVKVIRNRDRVQLFSILRDVTAQKKAHDDLRASEEKFRLLVEGINDYAIFMLDLNGNVMSCNPAAERIFGYSLDEIVGKDISRFYTREDQARDMLRYELQAAIEQGRNEVETWRVRKDGTLFWANVHTTPLRDPDGNLKGFVRITRDVTEKRRAEEKFKGLLESAPFGMVIVNPEGKIQIVNAQTEKLFGYRREELLDKSIETLIPERFRDQHQIHRTNYSQGPRVRPMGTGLELYGLHKNKYEFPIDVSLSPLDTDEGTLFIAGVNDISERKRVEELVRKSEASLSEAQRVARVGSWEWDIEKNVVSWSDQLFQLFGLEPQSIPLRYESFLGHVHPDDRQMVDETIKRALHDHAPFGYEERIVWDDGSMHWLQGNGRVVLNELGQPLKMYGTCQDIDERKRYEQELHASREGLRALTSRLVESQETERRRIASELHDEFGQVLTGLKMELEAAARSSGDATRQILVDAQAQVANLMEQTRALSRELRPSVLDDLGLLPALLSQIDRYGAQTNVQVDFKQSGLEDRRFPPTVEIAAYRIVQEALTNVARYAKVKQVRVRVLANDESIHLQVEDQGAGFDPESAVASAASSGLVGMRERVLSLGGQFAVESMPGNGTSVIAKIPLENGRDAQAKTAA